MAAAAATNIDVPRITEHELDLVEHAVRVLIDGLYCGPLTKACNDMIKQVAESSDVQYSDEYIALLQGKKQRAGLSHARSYSGAIMRLLLEELQIPSEQRTDAKCAYFLRVLYAVTFAKFAANDSICCICRRSDYDPKSLSIEHAPLGHQHMSVLSCFAFMSATHVTAPLLFNAMSRNCDIACGPCNSARAVSSATAPSYDDVREFCSRLSGSVEGGNDLAERFRTTVPAHGGLPWAFVQQMAPQMPPPMAPPPLMMLPPPMPLMPPPMPPPMPPMPQPMMQLMDYACTECTFVNVGTALVCLICEAPRPME
jgi:hypothetical protein